eukprot:scaffold67312_cov18-Tisochrysis_lutea.AAC.1
MHTANTNLIKQTVELACVSAHATFPHSRSNRSHTHNTHTLTHSYALVSTPTHFAWLSSLPTLVSLSPTHTFTHPCCHPPAHSHPPTHSSTHSNHQGVKPAQPGQPLVLAATLPVT